MDPNCMNQLKELDELRNEAYENAKIYKAKINAFRAKKFLVNLLNLIKMVLL